MNYCDEHDCRYEDCENKHCQTEDCGAALNRKGDTRTHCKDCKES